MIRKGKAGHKTIWLYISKEFFLTFAISFLFFFLVFFVNQMLLMAEDILAKRAPPWDVLRLIVYATPAVLALAFPFASLTGALMAAGRLSSDSELLVLQSSGVSQRRVMAPFLALGLVFTAASFLMNDALLPLGTMNFSKLYRKILASSPALELTPYSARRWEGLTIVSGEVDSEGISDVLILDKAGGGKKRIITAKRGRLSESEPGVLTLRMQEVFSQVNDASRPGRFEWSEAESLEYNLLLKNISEMSFGISPREMSARDLGGIIEEKKKAQDARRLRRSNDARNARAEALDIYEKSVRESRSPGAALADMSSILDRVRGLTAPVAEERTLRVYRLEYYKKLSIPAGAFCFVILAYPLATLTKRSGKATGFGIGILVAVIYWALLAGGQTLGTRIEGISPFWAMWTPNFFILFLGALAFAVKKAAG